MFSMRYYNEKDFDFFVPISYFQQTIHANEVVIPETEKVTETSDSFAYGRWCVCGF